MTAAAIIAEIARASGRPVQAVETAAVMAAPVLTATRAMFCPRLAEKYKREIEARLELAGKNKARVEPGQERG